MFGWQRLGAFEDLAAAVVGAAHFTLLVFGQSQDAQRQNFVDLGAVEKISRAFGRDLRVVVKNDRRG